MRRACSSCSSCSGAGPVGSAGACSAFAASWALASAGCPRLGFADGDRRPLERKPGCPEPRARRFRMELRPRWLARHPSRPAAMGRLGLHGWGLGQVCHRRRRGRRCRGNRRVGGSSAARVAVASVSWFRALSSKMLGVGQGRVFVLVAKHISADPTSWAGRPMFKMASTRWRNSSSSKGLSR